MAKENLKYYKRKKIPVRIMKGKQRVSNVTQKGLNFGVFSHFLKKAGNLVLLLSIISAPVYLVSAFEAHVINVTARICLPSETHTMGFWRNHLEDYNSSCLPQYLGDEEIGTIEEAYQIFDDANADVMKDMLKGQLLAMKLNIDCLGIDPTEGEEFDGETLEEIVDRADDILRDSNATIEEQEEMKDLLDYLNNLQQIKYCSTGNNFFVESQGSFSAMVYNFLSNPISNENSDEEGGNPETYIIIAYPNSPTTNPEAYLAFNSSVQSATFQCKINSLDWVNCTSPKTYSGLTPGDYLFQVFATDAEGKYDETPATYSWTIIEEFEGQGIGEGSTDNPDNTTTTDATTAGVIVVTDNGTTTDATTTDEIVVTDNATTTDATTTDETIPAEEPPAEEPPAEEPPAEEPPAEEPPAEEPPAEEPPAEEPPAEEPPAEEPPTEEPPAEEPPAEEPPAEEPPAEEPPAEEPPAEEPLE